MPGRTLASRGIIEDFFWEARYFPEYRDVLPTGYSSISMESGGARAGPFDMQITSHLGIDSIRTHREIWDKQCKTAAETRRRYLSSRARARARVLLNIDDIIMLITHALMCYLQAAACSTASNVVIKNGEILGVDSERTCVALTDRNLVSPIKTHSPARLPFPL